MHKPSGLGIYALGQWENPEGAGATGIGLGSIDFITGFDVNAGAYLRRFGVPCNQGIFGLNPGGAPFVTGMLPIPSVLYIKPFWRKVWWPAGATVLYGEYGQYNDQFIARRNLCTPAVSAAGFGAAIDIGNFCGAGPFATAAQNVPGLFEGVFVTGSETRRFGLGVVQEIDSAAMHVFARWQHQELDVDLVRSQPVLV